MFSFVCPKKKDFKQEICYNRFQTCTIIKNKQPLLILIDFQGPQDELGFCKLCSCSQPGVFGISIKS